MTVAKFDSSGNRLWTADHGGNTLHIGLDGTTVYIAGDTIGGANLRKLDTSSGSAVIAASALHSVSGPAGAVTAMSVMANGDVVTGTGVRGTSYYGTLARWDNTLSNLWETSTGRAFRRPIYELSDGTIISENSNSGGTRIQAFDPDGNSLWTSANSLSGPVRGESNVTTVNSGSTSDRDWFYEDWTTVDSSDQVWGFFPNSGTGGFMASVYDASGSHLFDVTPGTGNGDGIITREGVTVLSQSSGFTNTIETYDDSSTLLASYSASTSYNPNYFDSLGNVYLNKCQGWSNANTANMTPSNTIKLDAATLTVAWTVNFGNGYRIKHVDSAGNIYAVSGDFTTVKKFNSSGSLVWTLNWPAIAADTGKDGQVFRITSDGSGNVYIAGERVRAR